MLGSPRRFAFNYTAKRFNEKPKEVQDTVYDVDTLHKSGMDKSIKDSPRKYSQMASKVARDDGMLGEVHADYNPHNSRGKARPEELRRSNIIGQLRCSGERPRSESSDAGLYGQRQDGAARGAETGAVRTGLEQGCVIVKGPQVGMGILSLASIQKLYIHVCVYTCIYMYIHDSPSHCRAYLE